MSGGNRFEVHAPFGPAGDQPQAIAGLAEGVGAGEQSADSAALRMRVSGVRISCATLSVMALV